MTPEIRKHQHTLVITGNAVILFGIWDIVKTVLNITVNDILSGSLEAQAAGYDALTKTAAIAMAAVLVAIVTAVSIAMRLYVGRRAIRLGRGETAGCGLIVFWIIILILFNAAGVPLSIIGIRTGEDILNMTGSLILDITSCITLTGMLIALYKLRKTTR